jgi:mannitol 2-dehydrogenase
MLRFSNPGRARPGSFTANVEEPIKLCWQNIDSVNGLLRLRAFQYDRKAIKPGIVNIGLRDFHRVHNAVFFDKLLEIPSNQKWGLVSVAIGETQKRVANILKSQDSLYTVVAKGANGESDIRVVGSVLNTYAASSDLIRIVDNLSNPETKIITLTINESDFFLNKDLTRMNMDHPIVLHDLLTASASKPFRTPAGILVEGLNARFMKNKRPITILSCANLPRNGEMARLMVEAFALHKFPMKTEFHRWLSTNVSYPNTMCDRICLTDPSNDRIALQEMGVRDDALVTTESYSEWVVEKWLGDKPEGMEDVGIHMVGSSVPYENLKIRLNYGTRLSVAVIARALGYETFEAALADNAVMNFLLMYMAEVEPGLGVIPKDVNLEEYKKSLIERLRSAQLNYLTHRLVEAASEKAKIDWQSVLMSLPVGCSTKAFEFTFAVWIHLLANSSMLTKTSRSFPLVDITSATIEPIAKEIVKSCGTQDAPRLIEQFLVSVFGSNIPRHLNLHDGIIKCLRDFEKIGIHSCLIILR